MPYLAKLVFCFSAGATLLTGAGVYKSDLGALPRALIAPLPSLSAQSGAQGPQAAVAPLGRAIFGAIESSTLAVS